MKVISATRPSRGHPEWTGRFEQILAAREPFRTGGALSGVAITPGEYPEVGRLPSEWVDEFHGAASVDEVDYVVYSYSTPIAWHIVSDDDWVMPDESYSPTTNRHQSTIRRMLT